MDLIPALTLKNGQTSRLQVIDDRVHITSDDPVEIALGYEKMGIEWINIHDLDARIHGRDAANEAMIKRLLAEGPLHIQYGGGLRTMDDVRKWLDLGVHRVIVGSMALNNPQTLEQACKEFPGQIVLGLRVEDGFVTNGQHDESTGYRILDMALRFDDIGLAAMILLDINRDGSLKGINIDMTADIAFALQTPVIAAGGVGSLHDLQDIKSIEDHGVIGIVCGRALSNGQIPVTKALGMLRAPNTLVA